MACSSVNRIALALMSAALALTGCSGAVTTTPLRATQQTALLTPSLTSPPASMDVFTSSTALGTSVAGPVVPLFGLPGVQTTDGNFAVVLWGAKDAAGNIIDVTQAGITVPGSPPEFVQAYFGASALPVLFYDDATGISLAVFEDSPTQVTATLCDRHGAAIESATVNGATQTVAGGGSCLQKSALGGHRFGRRAVSSDFTCAPAVPPSICAWANGSGELIIPEELSAAVYAAVVALYREAFDFHSNRIALADKQILAILWFIFVLVPSFHEESDYRDIRVISEIGVPSFESGTFYAPYVP